MSDSSINSSSGDSPSLRHRESRTLILPIPSKRKLVITQQFGQDSESTNLDKVDKDLKTYAMRMREWYGWHFPEIIKIVPDTLMFAEAVKAMGMRANAKDVNFSNILPKTLEIKLKETAEISMGTEISEKDIISIQELCDQVIDLIREKERLLDYSKNKMNSVAPNVSRMDTGGAVWGCGALLSFVVANSMVEQAEALLPAGGVRGKRVLEIGAGTGLVSIACKIAGAAFVHITDGSEKYTKLARYNAHRNLTNEQEKAEGLVVSQYVWGSKLSQEILDSMPIDVLIMSDCMYEADSYGALLETIELVRTVSTKPLHLWIANRARFADREKNFYNVIKDLGFQRCDDVKKGVNKLFKDKSCQQYIIENSDAAHPSLELVFFREEVSEKKTKTVQQQQQQLETKEHKKKRPGLKKSDGRRNALASTFLMLKTKSMKLKNHTSRK
eukprot:jgi/Bigna1/134996/aug1.27_g9704